MQTSLRIIDRYIAKEILLTWSAVMFVLLLVMMSVEFAKQLSWLAEGRIDADSLLPLTAISLVKNFIKIMPLTFLLAVLLAFGRLYKDSEMAAMMSASMGPASWYRPVFMITVPAAMLLLMLSLFVVPELYHARASVIDDARSKSDLSSMMAGRFNPSGSGNAVFFLESRNQDAHQSDGIFFRQMKDGVELLDIAQSATSTTDAQGSSFLVMHDGKQYIGDAGHNRFRVIEYDEYAVRINSPERMTGRSLKSTATSDLLGSDRADMHAELYWRVAMPVAMFLLAALAVPLSYTKPRAGRYSKLALALIVYIVYANFLGVSKRWIADGSLHVWTGSAWPHLAMIGVLLFLLWKQGYLVTGVRQRGAS